jgi:hypothetical protein
VVTFGGPRYVKPLGARLFRSPSPRATSFGPVVPGGVVAVMLVELFTTKLSAATPPIGDRADATEVGAADRDSTSPPLTEPLEGLTLVTSGGGVPSGRVVVRRR